MREGQASHRRSWSPDDGDGSFYGEDLTGNRLWIETGEGHFSVKRTKRIGIDYAKYGRNFPWRMVLEDNIYVSK